MQSFFKIAALQTFFPDESKSNLFLKLVFKSGPTWWNWYLNFSASPTSVCKNQSAESEVVINEEKRMVMWLLVFFYDIFFWNILFLWDFDVVLKKCENVSIIKEICCKVYFWLEYPFPLMRRLRTGPGNPESELVGQLVKVVRHPEGYNSCPSMESIASPNEKHN